MSEYIPFFVIKMLHEERLAEAQHRNRVREANPIFRRRQRPGDRIGELLIRLGSRLAGPPAPAAAPSA